MRILSERHVLRSRKSYICNSCEFLITYLNDIIDTLTFIEKRVIVKARKSGFRINPVEPYVRQFIEFDGAAYMVRFISGIHSICLKYDLYG